MNIAVSYHAGRERAAPESPRSAGKLARVEVFEDMLRRSRSGDASKPAVRSPPPISGSISSPPGSIMSARAPGVTPFIVVGFDDAGEPLFLWPFGRTQNGLLKVVQFLGSKHANFNVGLWRRDSLAATARASSATSSIVSRLEGIEVDLVALLSQPLAWDGIANPFTLLAHQASVDMSAQLNLDPHKTRSTGLAPRCARPARQGTQAANLAGYRYLLATRRGYRSAARRFFR